MERMIEAWRIHMPRIVVASYIEREMRGHGSNDDIYVVHNGVDRDQYFSSGPGDRRSGVGTVFHSAYTKGPELMLSTFQRIRTLRPNIPLMMFGSYPQPAGLPAGTEYLRLPSIPRARDMYSRAEIWLCTSRSEGFPGPVLEAMACGCAIVATDCGGTADQIEDGVNGFLVPVDDVVQMAERVLRLLGDPGLRQQMVNASELRLARFAWPDCICSLEAALAEIVAKASPRLARAESA
jgi:glycosyltransferase involved in cell wall biosynthesis